MPTHRRTLALGALLLAAGLIAAYPYQPTDRTVPVTADWKTRADAWFTTADVEGRREQMRTITRALRQACQYCHTPDFTAYTDKLAVSRQMMALSAEHGVACEDCHGGRDSLTDLGQRSASMWSLAIEKQVFCESCHVPKSRFTTLTPEGERFRQTEWAAWQKAHPAPAATAPASTASPSTAPGIAPRPAPGTEAGPPVNPAPANPAPANPAPAGRTP